MARMLQTSGGYPHDTDRRVAMVVLNSLDPDPRVWREAESLARAGWGVVVLAGKRPDQKRVEEGDGFVVLRLFQGFPYGPRPVETLLVWTRFLSYVFSRKRRRFSVVHCHDAETLPLGWVLSRSDGAKLVYDAHELFFDYVPADRYLRSPWQRFKNRVLRGVMSLVERRAIGRCDRVFTVNSSLSRMIEARYGLKERPEFLYNARRYTSVERTTYLRERLGIPVYGKILFYQGAIRPDREIERMIEILPLLEEEWFLVVAGQVSPPRYLDRLRRLAGSLCVGRRFSYGGFLDYEKELLLATASSDMGLFLLPPTNLTYRFSLANKLFDYVMAEIPMIVSDLPEMRGFVEKYGLGIAVDLERRDEIAGAITRLAEDRAMYRRIVANIREAKKELCWEKQEGKLVTVYQELSSSS
ncbi:MAG: glycosyltransferase [Deltaproteobacteria bacterium]|nr:glycosyltransferase [Deltaproteobacteria bacterium]